MKKSPIINITLLSVGITLYWFFHNTTNPYFFTEISILTAFTIMLVILLPAIEQPLRK
jgi:hypothetical protein